MDSLENNMGGIRKCFWSINRLASGKKVIQFGSNISHQTKGVELKLGTIHYEKKQILI